MVGEYEKFDENSVPVLSVNSLPNLQLRNIYSNIKKYEFLKSIKGSNVYVSQYMNSSQIISSMFEIKNQIPNCMSFYTFYNEFINSSNNVGLFPFEIEETSIIIAISKEMSNCSMYIFGIINLIIDIKLSNILVNLNLSISKIINVNNCEIHVLKTLTHLAIQENIHIVSEELFKNAYSLGEMPREEVEKFLSNRGFDFSTRRAFTTYFGWSVPCKEAVEAIKKYARQPLYDVLAGTGYWTKILKKAGINVIASDIHKITSKNYYHRSREDLPDISNLIKPEKEKILNRVSRQLATDGGYLILGSAETIFSDMNWQKHSARRGYYFQYHA